EQTFDVELQNPVVSPAALTRDTDGIEGRFSRPIAIRVRQKDWIQIRLDKLLHNHLSHAISYSGHTQNPLTSSLFGYGDGTHRRRKVASRTHPIPELVEIALQVVRASVSPHPSSQPKIPITVSWPARRAGSRMTT